MSGKIPLVHYLFRRLKQCGVHFVHEVPGDFTSKALDHLKPSGIKWVGNCNELNAGYAADGYARINGLGALFTTYGVGELAAINAIAGSLAERRANFHHSLGDGRLLVFKKMHLELLKHGPILDNEELAPQYIESAIRSAKYLSKPKYLALPCDMFTKDVLIEPLQEALEPQILYEAASHEAARRIITLLPTAKKPLILVDRGGATGPEVVRADINSFERAWSITLFQIISGLHAGPVGQIDTSDYVASADIVLTFGTMSSDTQTLGWKILPLASKTLKLFDNRVTFLGEVDTEGASRVNIRTLLRTLVQQLNPSHLPKPDTSSLGNFRTIKTPRISDHNTPIDQTSLYLRLNTYLRPHDIILLGNATPILGGRDFILPDASCRVIASGMWFSIGHMLPAALGTALAQQRSPGTLPDHGRVVLFDGDGAFQVTAQELSSIIHQRLNVTIFIINNDGYAYERLIHGLNEPYNDIAPWDYLALPEAFGAAQALKAAKDAGEVYSIDTIRLGTHADLEAFLNDEKFDNGHCGGGARGLKLVDIKVGRTDVPEKFKVVFESAGQNL